MKKNFLENNLVLYKIIIISNFIIYSLLLACEKDTPIIKNNQCVSTYCNEEQYKSGECIIDNPLIKEKWLNDIMIFKNTNGEIFLSLDYEGTKLIFGSTLSNNEERLFYGLYNNQMGIKYIFGDDNNHAMTINKTISITENKKAVNREIGFLIFDYQKYIILIGNNNSYIEMLNLKEYTNDIFFISPKDFLTKDIIIRGISMITNSKELFLGITTITNNDPSNYNFYIYKYTFSFYNNRPKYNQPYIYNMGKIKGENINCDTPDKLEFLSCIYLNEDNNYTITLYEMDINYYFQKKNSFIIGSPAYSNEEKNYFLKGIVFKKSNNFYGFYGYYSNNDIPTFIYKNIEIKTYTINDRYDNFPIIYLNDYSFNGDYKYNDLIQMEENQFYFISTLKNREDLIISYIYYYISTKTSENQLIVRYYIIKLKEYYNLKIFQGFKAVSFNKVYNTYLVLAINFCLYDSCQNSENIINNSGLIFFSYPKLHSDKNIDFIEYAFKYNIKSITLNLTENYTLINNIFGYNNSIIFINNLFENENVEIIFSETGEPVETYFLPFEKSLIKMDFTNYNFEDIDIFEEPIISYSIRIQPPQTIEEFNKFCDNYNDTFGNIKDESSFSNTVNDVKESLKSFWYLKINEELNINCTQDNCNLCLKNDLDYCIVCDGNYKIIYNESYKYGKKKICINNKNEVNITDEFTNENYISSDNIINESTRESYINMINTDESMNKKDILILSNTDIISKDNNKSSEETDDFSNEKDLENNNFLTNQLSAENEVIKDISSDELTERNEQSKSDSNSNENEITNDIYTDELSNENELSKDIYTDELSNENEITNEINIIENEIETNNIKNELSNENEIINNIITDELSYEKNENEISGEIKISELDYENESITYSTINEDKFIYENEISSIIETNKFEFENKMSGEIKTDELEKENEIDKITNSKELSFEEFMNNEFKDINLSNEQIKKLYEEAKNYLYEKYNGNNVVINTGNVDIQISNIDAQKFSQELSNIDLGECEKILKSKYCKTENDSLIMLKIDIKPENETSTYVQYEIYEPISKIFLELEECTGTNVLINVPIELNSEMESLYDWLSQSGYNLFDANDSFYNDICAVYTTQNGTDILLYDRRMDIYQSTVNISLCQEGCNFQSYNAETKKAKCDCPIQTNEINTDISELKFDKNEMLEEFYETLDNSNFRVLKCYKLAFNLKVYKKNIGSIIMTILLILFHILVILHLIVSSKKINIYIQSILKNKYIEIENSHSNNSKKKKLYNENDKINNNDNILENSTGEKIHIKKKIDKIEKKEKKEIGKKDKKKKKEKKEDEKKEKDNLEKKKKKTKEKEKGTKKNRKSTINKRNIINIYHNIKINKSPKKAPPKRKTNKSNNIDISIGNSKDNKNTTYRLVNNMYISSNTNPFNLNESPRTNRKT